MLGNKGARKQETGKQIGKMWCNKRTGQQGNKLQQANKLQQDWNKGSKKEERKQIKTQEKEGSKMQESKQESDKTCKQILRMLSTKKSRRQADKLHNWLQLRKQHCNHTNSRKKASLKARKQLPDCQKLCN